jgi:hypothetical protein
MDLSALVEGGIDGMKSIVGALEAGGVNVRGAYLIKTTSDNGYEDLVFCVVTTDEQRKVINLAADLKRAAKLPSIDSKVRFAAARPSSTEASRIMAYAAEVGSPVVTIQGVGLDGLYVEDALVVKWSAKANVAA